MNIFAELQSLSLVCWPTLSLGLKNGWISKDAVSDYASQLLITGQDNGDLNVATLIGTNSLSHNEITRLIDEICKNQGLDLHKEEYLAAEKWRLARLSSIKNSPSSDENKTTALQELYAELGYPEDMAACSIYHQGETSPLAAMHDLIEKLKLTLT
ncbi:MAG: DUF2247 family protein [Pseudomonas sp.]